MNNKIGDMITRIRNAIMVNKDFVVIESNKEIERILYKLEELGYIKGRRKMREGVNGMKVKICIKLKYKYGESIIREIGLISKSSRRVYMDRNEISKIMGEDKITNFIITTKSGYKTGLEILRSGEGGEVIMYIK